QMDAMRQQQDGQAAIKQAQLNQALRAQEAALAEVRDFKVQRANDTAANAARLAALIGTPPPEKAASAPVIGSSRNANPRPKGRASLRIDRAEPQQPAGSPLSIPRS
ncbi:MAG: hypothetical protein VKI83_06740, partial [Synechococcaceae cyanobacterium]|nr:hypothetical protein [Synechococcaceae cyanobacterium]